MPMASSFGSAIKGIFLHSPLSLSLSLSLSLWQISLVSETFNRLPILFVLKLIISNSYGQSLDVRRQSLNSEQ